MPTIVEPGGGSARQIGSLGVVFKIGSDDTGGSFSVVEHPLAPRALAAPLHRHANEDECSYVLEGRLGAQLGDDLVEAGPGAYVFKPKGQWHTFWNAGDRPARIIEIFSRGGFERSFEEIAEVFADPTPDFSRLMVIAGRYGVDIDMSSVSSLVDKHGLQT